MRSRRGDAMGEAGRRWHHRRWADHRWRCPMPKPADLNRCLTPLDQDHTIIAVIEMSQSSWLVAGVVPGIARHPLKKLAPDQDALLKLLHRWRAEAGQGWPKSSPAGAQRRVKLAERSAALPSPSKPAAMASGWRAGSGLTASRPMSFTRPASR